MKSSQVVVETSQQIMDRCWHERFSNTHHTLRPQHHGQGRRTDAGTPGTAGRTDIGAGASTGARARAPGRAGWRAGRRTARQSGGRAGSRDGVGTACAGGWGGVDTGSGDDRHGGC